MITTVTLNAAIDKTYFMPDFHKHRVNRVQRMYSEPGGKGINVAKVLNLLDAPVTATGFVGGFNGQYICHRLDELGIEHQFVSVEGESRLCHTVIDEGHAAQTEILEAGPAVQASKWQHLKETVSGLATTSRYVVFSGSLPQGLDTDAYAELMALVRAKGAKPIVDTSGPALEQALQARPFMVKPNEDELTALLNQGPLHERDIISFMKDLNEQGIAIVCVSLGSKGAMVACYGDVMKVVPPLISAVNPVGCGDAFVAGLVAALVRDQDIRAAATLATATAAANALQQRAGWISVRKVEELKKEVKLRTA